MTTLFFSAAMTAALSMSPITAPNDTIHQYLIDGKKVENFDGSQLVGETIRSYEFVVADLEDGSTLKIHVIETYNIFKPNKGKGSFQISAPEIKIKGAEISAVEPLVYVNGSICSPEDFKKIEPETISAIWVYKAGSNEAKELSGRDDVQVIKVNLK